MKYNFDEMIDRRGTESCKWGFSVEHNGNTDSSKASDILPLWVADMDFRTAPCIIDALHRRVEHGVFGYTQVADSYYEAVCRWFSSRHSWNINPKSIIYTSGVVPAVSAIIKALTKPGDKVLVQTPVYNCFFSSIRNNGCIATENVLIYDKQTYTIDFDDFERRAADPTVSLMILCNPHNPAGRVWTRDELMRIGEICLRNGVTVLADEIHCELVFDGHRYTPYASLSNEFAQHSVSCVSPSKAFNIAGLQIANIVCANDALRAKIDRAINDNEVCDVNPFGVIATRAAYNEGQEWLEQMLDYVYENYRYMSEFCAEHLPQFPLTKLEGTYLVWMDCRCLGIPSLQLEEQLVEQVGLWLNAGAMYGAAGEGFMRWNIACPRERLASALLRFGEYVAKVRV